jgi:hypothetical protein
VLRRNTVDLVGIGLRLRRLLNVDVTGYPARQLHALVAELGGPLADVVQRVEWGLLARKLCEENGRSLDRAHECPPLPHGGLLYRLRHVPHPMRRASHETNRRALSRRRQLTCQD